MNFFPRIVFLTPLLILPLKAQQFEENEIIMKFRTANQNAVGASDATQKRIGAKVWTEIVDSRINIESGVVTSIREDILSNFFKPNVPDARLYAGKLGMLTYWAGDNINDFDKHATWATIKKSYQDWEAEYIILVNDNNIADSFRVGQKISVAGTIHCFVQFGNQVRIALYSPKITLETKVKRCVNGHEYAPAAGYKFCPQCGGTLNK